VNPFVFILVTVTVPWFTDWRYYQIRQSIRNNCILQDLFNIVNFRESKIRDGHDRTIEELKRKRRI
jgi:hypothetical protein